jgi:hypothetical protein
VWRKKGPFLASTNVQDFSGCDRKTENHILRAYANLYGM